ncbi:hypothetical protein ACTJK4_25045 [Ralstonia sp. 22111]|uniref:hypothetical protein n=1 Tax=Ralstonia sp. 22111 TaxID=3453878 RepID=UPI003F853257
MKLNVEGKASLSNPTAAQIARAIRSLKSYGRSSYASLTNESGSFVQVAGGGVSCMVELFDLPTKVHSRAFHDKPSTVRPDGTILVFGGGNLPMRSDEWFIANQVAEIFLAFRVNDPFPSYVSWRPAPAL